MICVSGSIKKKLTVVGVRFGSVAVLKTVGPGSLVLGGGRVGLPHSVSPFRALSPLPSVYPPAPRLDA